MPPPELNEAAIFSAALNLQSPEERALFLEQACAGNDELRQRVERLLNAYPQIGGFLEDKFVGTDDAT